MGVGELRTPTYRLPDHSVSTIQRREPVDVGELRTPTYHLPHLSLPTGYRSSYCLATRSWSGLVRGKWASRNSI